MDREWIRDFNKECGRELTLAFQVISQANNWGLTVATAIFGATLLAIIKFGNDQNPISFTYPTFATWYIIIFSWIIMLRFFIRSCIAHINIFRWNKLMKLINLYLSVPENDSRSKELENNCIKAINLYYFEWRSPIPMKRLIWDNLKLMYLWFMAPVIILFLWGLISLDIHNIAWGIGLLIFGVPTLLEILWFISYPPFRYAKFDESKCKTFAETWEIN